MDEDGDLFQIFSRLGNEIIVERDRHSDEGTPPDIAAFDLLAVILRDYHEVYCPREGRKSRVEEILGIYPRADRVSSMSTAEVREWVLSHCDQELESVPYKIIDALRGEYLTFLWRMLKDRKVIPSSKEEQEFPDLERLEPDDGEKVRSTLMGLSFNESYKPRWGFSYIRHELETARDQILRQEPTFIDSKMVEIIRDNTVLAFKSYSRFLQMLLSFYGQYAFGDVKQLVASLIPGVVNSRRYLDTCRLEELVKLLNQLGEDAKEKGENDQFWKEFSQAIVLKRDLVDGLQQICKDTVPQLKLATEAAYTVEEVPIIREYILRFTGHLMSLLDEYRAALPSVIALKAYRQDEDKRVRIDYIDEAGSQGVIREDIPFQPRSDFYLFPKTEGSPLIFPVEDRHQNFIIKNIRPLKSQLDDADLRTLFKKFERCQKALEKSGPQQGRLMVLAGAPSPLAKLGISQVGEIFDEALLIEAIGRALQESETDMIEFKAGPSDDKEIAKEMAALANTKGGVLVFGLPDDPTVDSLPWNQAVSGRAKLREREYRNGFLTRMDRVAKGPHGQNPYCNPPVKCIPHIRPAKQYLHDAEGVIIIVVVVPIEGDELCEVIGSAESGTWVRLRGSCGRITPEWRRAYRTSGSKQWMQ